MGKVVEGLSTPMICRIVGVAPSTLDYWVRTGLVEPSIREASGKRFTRWWSVPDAVSVRAVKALREAGCPLQTVRKAKNQVQKLSREPSRSLVLYWDGWDVLALEKWGQVYSAVRAPGQGVLHLLAMPVAAWRREIESVAVVLDLDELRNQVKVKRKRTRTRTVQIKPRSFRQRTARL